MVGKSWWRTPGAQAHAAKKVKPDFLLEVN